MTPLFWMLGCAHQVVHTSLPDVEVVTVRRAYTNAHVIRTDKGAILVDAGYEREAEALVADLERAGVSVDELDLVVVTHGHSDHAGGARWLQQQHGIEVVAGAGDVDDLARGRNGELCPTDRVGRKRLAETEAERFEPLVPDTVVAAGDTLELDVLGVPAAVHAIPGHTPGSLVVDVGDAVLVGDLLRGSITGKQARTHFYQCDLADNRSDVRDVLDTSQAATWFPGHFGPLPRARVERWLDAD